MAQEKPAPEMSLDIFLKDPEVLAAIAKLKAKFGDNLEKLNISDTLDGDGHQYVNLVQKGGGVLGVALVGYTYILEYCGIRFLRLAGTSAGAINTALMTVIGNKQEEKSTKILQYLREMSFFSFVDGHPFARWLIKNFVSDKTFEKQLIGFFKGLAFSLLGLLFIDFVALGLRHSFTWAFPVALMASILTWLNLLVIILVVAYGSFLLGRFKACGYGINPGVAFYEWVKERMEENKVFTVSDLSAKASSVPDFHIRPGNSSGLDGLDGDVTFITSELVSENKIQFPLMTDLFRDDINDIHPARFVRASMSIPLFFESHIINDIPVGSEKVKKAWFDHLKIEPGNIPQTARFVDGGMLSNFPINLFYNPAVMEPRLPVFGIDLDDSDPKKDTGVDSPNWALGDYLWRLFNTIRYYYDKDFIEKNYVYQRGIGSIKLFGVNWLNFFLTDKDKVDMFRKGVLTATEFLLTFDWPEYKRLRTGMQTQMDVKNQKIAK